jgi:asparagine synthase (glutamine-hydrolysing)
MCGISGVIFFTKDHPPVDTFLDILESSIKHRGPDGSGRHSTTHAGFLNVRLAIVDREGGAQPIYNQDP